MGMATPTDRTRESRYNLIGGLPACRTCGYLGCWLQYLRWEARLGITLNADQHPMIAWLDEVISNWWWHYEGQP